MKLKIITKQGDFVTNSEWNMVALTKELNVTGFDTRRQEQEIINIGDFIFRKKDIIRVELIRN